MNSAVRSGNHLLRAIVDEGITTYMAMAIAAGLNEEDVRRACTFEVAEEGPPALHKLRDSYASVIKLANANALANRTRSDSL